MNKFLTKMKELFKKYVWLKWVAVGAVALIVVLVVVLSVGGEESNATNGNAGNHFGNSSIGSPNNSSTIGGGNTTLVGSEGLEYTLSEDGEYYIVSGIGTCADEKLVISSKHEGLPVTHIAKEAFQGYSTIKSLTIDKNITTIEEGAFFQCSNLETLTNIGDRAFEGTAYYTDDSNWTNEVLYIGKYLVKANTSLSGDYKVKDGTVVIATNAFYGCENVTSVYLPYTIKEIGEGAFTLCKNMTTINFPYDLKEIKKYTFQECSALTNITLPDELTTIGESAFNGCSALTVVRIPSKVVKIGKGAFLNSALNRAFFSLPNLWELSNGFTIPRNELGDAGRAATELTRTFVAYDWEKIGN